MPAAKITKKTKRTSYSNEFSFDKETPGTARFSEDEEDRAKAMVRTQYIRKELWKDFGECDAIRVTIEPIFR